MSFLYLSLLPLFRGGVAASKGEGEAALTLFDGGGDVQLTLIDLGEIIAASFTHF